MGANHVLVGPMQASELRRVVELPAGRVGLRVEPELADALVDDVEGEPGALPLLSTALLELWQKRDDNALALAAYREQAAFTAPSRGSPRAPTRASPTGASSSARPHAAPGRRGRGRRGGAPPRPVAELDLERNHDAADVLATLAENRLVTIDEGIVEVAHEALLREWPRLREWIEEDAEGRRLRRHITQAATEWDAAGRDQGELYRGARLATASTGPPITRSRSTSSSASSSLRAERRLRRRPNACGARIAAFAVCSSGSRSSLQWRRRWDVRRRPAE